MEKSLLPDVENTDSSTVERILDEREDMNENERCISLPQWRLFLQKLLVIVLASYAFLPLMAAHNAGKVSAVAYAVILVVLHVAFVIIYLWRVRYRELDDGDCRSLAARILGLFSCIGLLMLVAQMLTGKKVELGLLAAELLVLCLVHTLILALLMVRVRLPRRVVAVFMGDDGLLNSGASKPPWYMLKKGCGTRALKGCCTVSLIVAATAIATFFITKELVSGTDVCTDIVPVGCNQTLAFWQTYYGSEKVVGGAAEFKYSFLFAPNATLPRGDGNGHVHSGHMFICDQTTGMKASGPDNCTNSFSFDDHTCELLTQLSACQSQVQHKDTDVEIDWLRFDGVDDQIWMDGTTHMPGWKNPAKFKRVDSPITCPLAVL